VGHAFHQFHLLASPPEVHSRRLDLFIRCLDHGANARIELGRQLNIGELSVMTALTHSNHSQSETGNHHHDFLGLDPKPEQAMCIGERLEALLFFIPLGLPVEERIECIVHRRET
jgi:hypothetical protein